MKTTLLQINAEQPQADFIAQAAAIIRRGGLVAFPTETVYGLGADAMNEAAVQKIFQAKGRPSDNPLIVHVSSQAMLHRVAKEISAKAEALMEKFWPGPLTLVLQRREAVAPTVSAGLHTVAVRMPHHKIALALLEQAATPIAAPSANTSSRPSPTTAAHVLEDLHGRIEMILDGGPTNIGIESTVLDVTGDVPVMLRPGWVTPELLAEIVGDVQQAMAIDELKRSPGTRYRHYSPRARVVLLENAAPELLQQTCVELLKNERVGLISKTPVFIDDFRFTAILLADSAADYARRIYSAMRELDENQAAVIVIEGINATGVGAAVMDRLRRAASTIHS
ncbi:MAG: threonylcarbamoyl-AMP synthase [Acidobacteria bacterium]|nr:threonylcarbamoyl-AMP synthase [Acidobacteriota bacterium]